jgi:hypothetical protein
LHYITYIYLDLHLLEFKKLVHLVNEIEPKRIGNLFFLNPSLSSLYILKIVRTIVWKMEWSEKEKIIIIENDTCEIYLNEIPMDKESMEEILEQ